MGGHIPNLETKFNPDTGPKLLNSFRSQALPMRSKFHRTVGPVNLKLLPDQNKFHQIVDGQ